MTSGSGTFGFLSVGLKQRSGPMRELLQPIGTISLITF